MIINISPLQTLRLEGDLGVPGEHMFQRVEISDLQLNGIERWFRDGFLIFGRFSMEEKVYMGIGLVQQTTRCSHCPGKSCE